jgi:uroporphyrinogen decarboxylase
MRTGGRFLAACRREPVDRPPVWIMRQAGRYLPEYRRTRSEAGSFLSLCRTPRLAAEVTLQPLRRFAFDAAIIFSDILLPLTSLGIDFAFSDDGGPRLREPLRGPTEWAGLRYHGPGDDTRKVQDAIASVRAALPTDTALLGFCGAPWTLASYLVEGGTSRDHAAAKAALFSHPEPAGKLLVALADAMAEYLLAQVEAGADAVQVFDSWAGALSPAAYTEFVVPATRRLLERLDEAQVPRILYVGGGSHLLPSLVPLPVEVVSVDWRTDLLAASVALPGRSVQGNLDPAFLLAPPDIVGEATRRMLAAAPAVGYIANLGHGIRPDTPVESVDAFLAAIQGGS